MQMYLPAYVAEPIIREVLEDRLYRYFALPNALLPEGSLRLRERVELRPFAVLDTVLVHVPRFCRKAGNRQYRR